MSELQITLALLAAFPAQLEALFDCFAPTQRNWKPASWSGIPSERLSAIEQVCHVRDIEIEGYQLRLERTRRESNPVLADLPGEQMAQERSYAHSDPTSALRAFRKARAETLATIEGCTGAELARTAIFEGRATSLRGLVHLLASHDQQHLAGLQWLLAQIAGAEVSRLA